MNVIECMEILKKTARSRKPSFGSWQALSHPSITEILVHAGFEWLVIDMEHSVIGLDTLQPLLQTAQALDCPALVRVPCNDETIIKRVLDAGASGLIVPMINTLEDVNRAVEAAYYPPVGKRGTGLARAQNYGTSFQKYVSASKKNTVLFVQIEHAEGVKNAEAILSHEHVDGFLLGPYDLSASYGIAGQLQHPWILKAESDVLKIAHREKKVCGIHIVHPTPSLIQSKVKKGFQFLALGTDFLYLGDACRAMAAQARKIIKKRK